MLPTPPKIAITATTAKVPKEATKYARGNARVRPAADPVPAADPDPELGATVAFRDYAMPGRYTPRLKQWRTHRIAVTYENGHVVRATIPGDPKKGPNVGHGLRVAASFYRADKHVCKAHGFDDHCKAIPVPNATAVTIDGASVADLEACNRCIRETVPFDPNDKPWHPRMLFPNWKPEKQREAKKNLAETEANA